MDLNQLLYRHQLSLMQRDRAASLKEQQAHSQFARDYAEDIQRARDELGAPAPLRTSDSELVLDHECSSNEAVHAPSVTARVVLVPGTDMPYNVVISRDGEGCSGHLFRTMREAEAFVRRNVQAPAERCTVYDRKPGQA